MKFQTIVACMTVLCCAPHGHAEWAAVDYEQSSLGFEVQSGVRAITGVFGRWSAEIAFDRDDPESASFRAVAENGSIELSDAIAQTIVATPAWLAAKEFPVAAFESETVKAIGDGSYQVNGTLILRGVSFPVVLAVEMNDPSDRPIAEVTGRLDRSDFAIGSNFGPQIVNSVINLNATVVLSQ